MLLFQKRIKLNSIPSTSSENFIEKSIHIKSSGEMNPFSLKSNLSENELKSDLIVFNNFPIYPPKTLKLPLQHADLSPIFPTLGKSVECQKNDHSLILNY